jgi:DNA helicase-2/ATP-dependent DNA helicase PcrA
MDRCRRTILDRQAADWHADGESVFRVIEAYERDLRAKGLVDFDDMILLGLRLVERHGWVRRLLKARFPVLVVDEYQDLGLPLHRIVSSLCFQAGVRLLAVGDPDQSIYGFTGAKPKLLRELAQWPDVDSVQLRMNYRCGTSIVRASEIVLGLESGRFGCPADAPEGTIEFHTYPDGIEEQARKICTEIIPMALERRKERKLGDVAVLYLDKNDGDKIATAAQGASFECIRIDRNAPYERTRLTRWLEDCAAWCVGGWREGEPRLSALINTWMGFNGRFGCSDGLTIELRRRLVRCLWEHRDTDLSLRVWLDALYSDCLQYTFDDRCESQDESEILKQLRRACAPGGKMANWTVAAFAGQGGSPTHLNLITLHSAKGREFEVVIMMGMDQGRIPWSNDKAKEKAEKRRLFYVGLTRAKREVHIVYSGWCSDRYGRPHCCGPSEFVKELRQRLAG